MSGHPPPDVTTAEIETAKAGLARLRAVRDAAAQERAAKAAMYADWLQRHREQPQSRGGFRRLWSRP